MKQKTLIRLDKILKKVSDGNLFVVIAIITIIICPFFAVYQIWKYVVRKVKGKVYDSKSQEWITKEERDKKILKEKQTNREIPLEVENHIMPNKDDRFYFFEKRKLKIPYDKLVYVETVYDEKLHRFFKDNAEWLDNWQKWHGFDISSYSYEDIKEGMLYPQDFAAFKHGFLWHSPTSSFDKDSDIFGNIHYYFEIVPDSDIPIKEQMELFMHKIYDIIDWG